MSPAQARRVIERNMRMLAADEISLARHVPPWARAGRLAYRMTDTPVPGTPVSVVSCWRIVRDGMQSEELASG